MGTRHETEKMTLENLVFLVLSLYFVSCDQICKEEGICDTEANSVIEVNTFKECLIVCNDEEACNFFTFQADTSTCFTFSSCPALNTSSCSSCITSQKGCTARKLFVGPGFGSFGESEILSLPLSSSEPCNVQVDLPGFDYQSMFLVGGLVDSKVVLCGGLNNASQCNYLETDGTWNEFPSMNYRRNAALSLTLGNGNFIVLGGYDEYQDEDSEYTSEVFNVEQQRWVEGPELPGDGFDSAQYCVASINDTHFIIIGVYESYIAEENNIIEEIGFYVDGIGLHSCAAMSDGRVMIAGGLDFLLDLGSFELNIDSLQTVVILDPTTGYSTPAPSLPIGLMAPSIVADGDDMLVIGGFNLEASNCCNHHSPAFEVQKRIYRLSPGDTEWTLLENLKVERSSFPMFIFDSNDFEC